jgi:hypothetical protein
MTVPVQHLDNDLEVVREAIADFLNEQHGGQLNGIKVTGQILRPYSVISELEVSSDCGSRRFVLKRIKNNPMNAGIVDVSEQAVNEYGILSKLVLEFAKVSGCSVPRPVAVLPTNDAFIMEHVKGHVLDQDFRFIHYFSSHTKFRELRNHMYLSGKWLRYFQEFTGRRPAATSAIDNVLLRYQNRLRIVEAAEDRRVPKDFCKLALEFLEKQIAGLNNSEILVTGRHGDFGPWNTLAGPDGVTVLDFFGYREDPLPVDILSVLVFLDSSGFGIANSASRIQKLREAFLEGFGPIPKLPEPLVLLCEAQQRILKIAGCVIAQSNDIFNRWERYRSLGANLEWFLTTRGESRLWPR